MTQQTKEIIIPQLVKDDPWLEPYIQKINTRIKDYNEALEDINKNYLSLQDFADGHKYYGFNYDKKAKGWHYREWAPNAKSVALIGDFNQWNREENPLIKNEYGVWEIFLDDAIYKKTLIVGSKLKIHVVGDNGAHDRIPAYIERVAQDVATKDFTAELWKEKKNFKWTDQDFDLVHASKNPLIYEAHIGIATEEEKVGSYIEFADNILPRIKKLGYTVVQLMAVKEHPYYGSFGYHVSNFFAPTSRCGTPSDLKYLVNKAHSLGIAVIMDMVHSHAVKNFSEGLNQLDGTDYQYFHEGGRGYHTTWDSHLFNYGKTEVKRFLLSNIKYWIEEFHFDGFRFDGVTSMMYTHHGDHVQFDHYDKYFYDVDLDALKYLQLANTLIHELKPNAISIAEDMSGLPGLCRTPEEGGIGFDFRLGMGIPDFWIKYLKEKRDEDWNIYELWSMMANRRWKEKTIAYAESHDQAIVGDKSIAFWLMDKDMYDHMSIGDENMVIDRGIALHKMIRLYTLSLGGEGYLNFIGNEFGHPEWMDFPREGNNWSYKYARRQWSLVDNKKLKYKLMNSFDKDMITLASKNEVVNSSPAQQLNMDGTNNVIIFERNNLIFIFNFHHSNSIPDYKFIVPQAGKYKIILNSDNKKYGGHNRIDEKIRYETKEIEGHHQLSLYLTNRTALVLRKLNR